MQLYNKLSSEERSKILDASNQKRITLSFYQYAKIKNPKSFRDELFIFWNSIDVLGRIYIAKEGVNAQLSLPEEKIKNFTEHLNSISFLKNVRLNIALKHEAKSFLKLKIKVRDKILADGLNDKTFDVTKKGVHLNAEEFNNLMNDKNSILIDMRNHYESEIGHFKNAICPDVDTFRDSLDLIENKLTKHKENKNLLMYCTGGIRCEKASSYLKKNGYDNVFQLSGGIIEYARQVKESSIENKFLGKNFVFDNRLSERISTEIVAKCHLCGEVSDNHVNCNNEVCHVLFIQCEKCHKELNGCCSSACKDTFELPIELRKKARKGRKNKGRFFKKGRLGEKV